MKLLLVMMCVVLFASCAVRDVQIRTIIAVLDKKELVYRYNYPLKWRVHYTEVGGWKITVVEDDIDLEDSAKYVVGSLYPIKLMR